ncbi:uroporphyrinogen-III synthase [Sphingomonas sp. KR1UV-12]|uniref:Uroporphyrinogen-III synthase n=1 Tax=Sphingomonas aurea TaxID=3063994 RepID=A0ABT9EJI5_9SPHN|nr:uroporphyrinogen-III synthase [Sphingomonas sp. KR1UV-12]MDP1027132.1 uroporphyrinogen-III synthase [Sphingomonas sp. KR1UV-12]
MSRSLAVLRPEPGNARTAAAIEALGFTAIRLPLFAVTPVTWRAPDPAGYDALVATSANAFRHGGAELARLRALPVQAVGAATAAAARAAGFAVATVGTADAASLIAGLPGRLLHLAGRERVALAGLDAITVYAADPVPVDAGVLAGSVVLLHSARAAARLAEFGIARDTVRLAALSTAVLTAAGGGWQRVAALDRPEDEALVALAVQLAD